MSYIGRLPLDALVKEVVNMGRYGIQTRINLFGFAGVCAGDDDVGAK